MKMIIIDLEGKEIEVTDIDEAIEQADTFMSLYLMGDTEYQKFFNKRKVYWEDMYQKLIKFKNENTI